MLRKLSPHTYRRLRQNKRPEVFGATLATAPAVISVLLVTAVVLATGLRLSAQTAPFTLSQVLSFPFPSDLVAAPRGSTIAWVSFERGLRSIYVAAWPRNTVTTSGEELPRHGEVFIWKDCQGMSV